MRRRDPQERQREIMRRAHLVRASGAVLALLSLLSAAPTRAAEAGRETFGMLDGKPVEAVVLSNAHGLKVRVIAYGAAIQSLEVPDRAGHLADVVLAYPDMAGYLRKPQYFGATVGRYANRIAGAKLELDGRSYALDANDGGNSLHGGKHGFDKVLWDLSAVRGGPEAAATFSYVSPDGEEGYPGELRVRVTYSLDDRDALTIRYEATTDNPTVLNLSNHSLFNMAGADSGRDVLGQRLMIAAETYTPVDAALIPTGELRAVAGGPFDFRTPHLIGARIRDGRDEQLVAGRGYDHNFVIRGGVTATPKLVARFDDPVSGRAMEILSTEPGLQFYSGNFLDGTVVGKGGQVYRQSDGIALEPQHFPDSPSHSAFPSTRLDPGQTYRQVSVYRFAAGLPGSR
jgi:aldose 1-epimerase